MCSLQIAYVGCSYPVELLIIEYVIIVVMTPKTAIERKLLSV